MLQNKLPKKTKQILANEIKRLFIGYEKVINVPITASVRTSVQIAWTEDVNSQFMLQDNIEFNLAKALAPKMVLKIEKAALQETKAFDKRISAFYKKFNAACLKYSLEPNAEFKRLCCEFKLWKHTRF